MVDYYAIKLLPLPVQSLYPREAAGYNGNFPSDQRQLAERNRSQLGRNWTYIANQLPLWWWQYSDVAIGRGRCGCNWCCSVAAREVGGTETTEAFPLIGLARGHGTCYRPRPLQPYRSRASSSDTHPYHRRGQVVVLLFFYYTDYGFQKAGMGFGQSTAAWVAITFRNTQTNKYLRK